jgi:hypothetical protein
MSPRYDCVKVKNDAKSKAASPACSKDGFALLFIDAAAKIR